MTTPPRPSDRRVQTVCLLTLTLIAVGVAMAFLQPVLVPFVLALFLSQCLAPLILLLMRRGLPRFVAVTAAVPLAALEVHFAAVFGLLALLLTFIPNLGGAIATLLPLPIVLLDPHLAIWVKVCALAVPGGIQVLIGSFLQPRMTGQSLDLHPVVILLSLLFFSLIWGVGGAFLAVPLTATFKIIFEKIPNTRPLAAALAGNLEPLTNSLDAPSVEAVAVVRDGQVKGERVTG